MTTIIDGYKLAVDGAEFGVWDFDVVHKKITCSPRIATLLGYPAYRVIEILEDFEALIVGEDIQRFREALRAQLEEFSPFSVDLRMLRKNGGIKWVSMKGGFQVSVTGQVERVSAVIFDIDRFKSAELKVRKISQVLAR